MVENRMIENQSESYRVEKNNTIKRIHKDAEVKQETVGQKGREKRRFPVTLWGNQWWRK